jgi:hypothetical protein
MIQFYVIIEGLLENNMFLLSTLLACTANLTVNGPASSTIYVVKTSAIDDALLPPTKNKEPQRSVCKGEGEVVCSVNYYAWNNYYWAAYDGSWSETGQIPNEVKIVPAIVGFWAWPVWVWAYGPEEIPVEISK